MVPRPNSGGSDGGETDQKVSEHTGAMVVLKDNPTERSAEPVDQALIYQPEDKTARLRLRLTRHHSSFPTRGSSKTTTTKCASAEASVLSQSEPIEVAEVLMTHRDPH